MCLAVIALDAHPRYRVVIAANRDEFHARAAAPAQWWDRRVLAGRDLVGGGTWFGATRDGRWALVTNFREGVARDPKAPSRGDLVMRTLIDCAPPLMSAASVAADGGRYHGFNLIVGDVGTAGAASNAAAYTSNRASGALALAGGIHGLSNHLLETPWPKLIRSKARLAAALERPAFDPEAAFDLLADRAAADDDVLPSTGLSPERERLLSSAFIVSPSYGTRCSTVFLLARDGSATFIERSFGATGTLIGEARYTFTVASMESSSVANLGHS